MVYVGSKDRISKFIVPIIQRIITNKKVIIPLQQVNEVIE